MAKIKYNVKGVERGTFEQPKPGLYTMEIKEANPRLDNGKNDIELVLEITKDNDTFTGSKLWTYINLGEASQWKLAEFTDALGLPESGTIDTDKLLGKQLKVKVNGDTYNNEYRARVGRMAPLSAEAEDADPDEDPDADATTSDDDPDAAASSDEPVLITRNDVELSNDPDYYDDWSDQDALDEVENQGLELGRKKKNKANVVAALVELVNEESGGGAAAAASGGDTYDDEEEWSDAAIAAEVKKRGLEVKGKRNRASFIAALREGDVSAEDDDPFAE